MSLRPAAALVLAATLAVAARPASGGEAKPVPVRTIGPAEALADRQQADLAAKRAATAVAATPVDDAPARYVAARRAPLPLPAVRIRRLPQVSDALGPIPREDWIRRALGKGPDVTISIPANAAPANGGPR